MTTWTMNEDGGIEEYRASKAAITLDVRPFEGIT